MMCIGTGGSDGIGFETALELARRGAQVIIASRHVQKGEEAARNISSEIFTSCQFFRSD